MMQISEFLPAAPVQLILARVRSMSVKLFTQVEVSKLKCDFSAPCERRLF